MTVSQAENKANYKENTMYVFKATSMLLVVTTAAMCALSGVVNLSIATSIVHGTAHYVLSALR